MSGGSQTSIRKWVQAFPENWGVLGEWHGGLPWAWMSMVPGEGTVCSRGHTFRSSPALRLLRCVHLPLLSPRRARGWYGCNRLSVLIYGFSIAGGASYQARHTLLFNI